ncbi:hypothetical protein TSOC_014294, partial [Tetrabaena socialis]
VTQADASTVLLRSNTMTLAFFNNTSFHALTAEELAGWEGGAAQAGSSIQANALGPQGYCSLQILLYNIINNAAQPAPALAPAPAKETPRAAVIGGAVGGAAVLACAVGLAAWLLDRRARLRGRAMDEEKGRGAAGAHLAGGGTGDSGADAEAGAKRGGKEGAGGEAAHVFGGGASSGGAAALPYKPCPPAASLWVGGSSEAAQGSAAGGSSGAFSTDPSRSLVREAPSPQPGVMVPIRSGPENPQPPLAGQQQAVPPEPVGDRGSAFSSSFAVPSGAEPHPNPPSGPGGVDGGGGSSGALSEAGVVAHQLSIVMAYCDRGTLRDALKGGAFNRPWEGMEAAGTGSAAAAGTLPSAGTCGAAAREEAAVMAVRGLGMEGSGAGTTGRNPPASELPDLEPQPQPGAGDAASPPRLLGAPAVGLAWQAEAQAQAQAQPRVVAWADVRAALNQPLALVAALDVARGLAYLHACNVVHGDLSLQNILITSVEPHFPEAAVAAAEAAAADVAAAAVAAAAAGLAATQVVAAAAVAAEAVAHGSRGEAQLEEGEEAQEEGKAVEPASPWDGCHVAAVAAGPGAVSPARAGEADADDDVVLPLPLRRMAGVVAGGVGASPVVDASSSRSGPDGRGGRAPTSSHVSAPSCVTLSSSNPPDADANTSTAANTGTLWGLYRAHNTGGTGGSGATPVGTPGASLAGGAGGGRGRLRLAQRTEALLPLLCQVFKISDFGLSGTPFFTAVEVLQSGQVAPAADIYSFGVCLWCLAHGVSLWCVGKGGLPSKTRELRHLLPSVYHPLAPSLTANTSPDLPPPLRALIRRCLASDASRRPSAPSLVAELTDMLQ